MWRSDTRICLYVVPSWSLPLSCLPLAHISPLVPEIMKQNLATVISICGMKTSLKPEVH